MRDAEENGETAGVGSFSDSRAAQEDPLNVSALGIYSGRKVLLKVSV